MCLLKLLLYGLIHITNNFKFTGVTYFFFDLGYSSCPWRWPTGKRKEFQRDKSVVVWEICYGFPTSVTSCFCLWLRTSRITDIVIDKDWSQGLKPSSTCCAAKDKNRKTIAPHHKAIFLVLSLDHVLQSAHLYRVSPLTSCSSSATLRIFLQFGQFIFVTPLTYDTDAMGLFCVTEFY